MRDRTRLHIIATPRDQRERSYTELEQCPRCGAGLWYPTDHLGRVVGRCDQCGRTYPHSTRPGPAKPPSNGRRRGGPDNVLTKVRAWLEERRGFHYPASEIARAIGCAERSAVEALRLLRQEGRAAKSGAARHTRWTARGRAA